MHKQIIVLSNMYYTSKERPVLYKCKDYIFTSPYSLHLFQELQSTYERGHVYDTSVVELSRLMSKPIQDSSFLFIVLAISITPESFFLWIKEVVVWQCQTRRIW